MQISRTDFLLALKYRHCSQQCRYLIQIWLSLSYIDMALSNVDIPYRYGSRSLIQIWLSAMQISHIDMALAFSYRYGSRALIQIWLLICDIDHAPSKVNLRERWGAGVETQKNVRGEIGGWGREPFHENYAPSLSTIYDGAQVS